MEPAKFRLVQTPNAGRALIATSDIAASQLIIADVASVVAPITHGDGFHKSIFCVACFKILPKVDKDFDVTTHLALRLP